MSSDAFKDIEKHGSDLRKVADNLRANSEITSSDYFMLVPGVIFRCHVANRFGKAQRQIDADQVGGNMPERKALPADNTVRRSGLPATCGCGA